MRRAAPLLLTATLLLAACGQEETSSGGGATGEIPAVQEGVSISAENETPVLDFGSSDAPGELQRSILDEGDGEEVESGDLLLVEYLGQVWGGSEPFDTSYGAEKPGTFLIGEGQVISGWDKTLVGLRTGSRVLLAIPPAEGYGEAGQPDAGIGGDDTLVFLIDILGSYGADSGADPEAEELENDTSITVTGELGEEPNVTLPTGYPAPERTTVTVLATGNGAEVETGALVLQYKVLDGTGAQVGSTWEDGQPSSGPVTADGEGPFDALAGIPVGSRVLLQVPESPQNPGGGTLVIVADIVDQPKR